MKNGFTILELLAVIVILAIILIIAVSSVNGLINHSRINAQISNEKMVLSSLELYLFSNQDQLPQSIGTTTQIQIDTLKQTGFLKGMSNVSGGYILVTKETNNTYNYNVSLDYYENNFTNGELLAHYKSDYFSEPTENLFTSLNLGVMSQGGLTYSYLGIVDGWHKYSISGTGTSDTYPYTFGILPSPINSNYKTSFSFLYKTNVQNKFISFGSPRMVNIIYKPGMTITDLVVGDYRVGKLENVSPLQTVGGVPIVGESSQRIYFLSRPISGMVFNPTTDFLYFKDFQVEKKSYVTEYTENIRTGEVLDYSINNDHVNLNLTTTPKFVETGFEKGAYDFNGVDTLIDLTSKQLNSPTKYNGGATVSMWIKPRSYENGFARYIGGFHYWTVNPSGKLQNMVNKPGLGINYWLYSSSTIPLNEWTHVTYTIKNNEYVSYYINGKLDAKHTSPDLEIVSYSTIPAIGATYNDYFDGLIDEVKVFNRALNEKEIELMYLKYNK